MSFVLNVTQWLLGNIKHVISNGNLTLNGWQMLFVLIDFFLFTQQRYVCSNLGLIKVRSAQINGRVSNRLSMDHLLAKMKQH